MHSYGTTNQDHCSRTVAAGSRAHGMPATPVRSARHSRRPLKEWVHLPAGAAAPPQCCGGSHATRCPPPRAAAAAGPSHPCPGVCDPSICTGRASRCCPSTGRSSQAFGRLLLQIAPAVAVCLMPVVPVLELDSTRQTLLSAHDAILQEAGKLSCSTADPVQLSTNAPQEFWLMPSQFRPRTA